LAPLAKTGYPLILLDEIVPRERGENDNMAKRGAPVTDELITWKRILACLSWRGRRGGKGGGGWRGRTL